MRKASESKRAKFWIILGYALLWTSLHAQNAPVNPTIDQLTKGCWLSKVIKQSQGKCPRKTEEDVLLCITPTMAGGAEGTLNLTKNESMVLDGMSPDVFSSCIGTANAVSGVTMAGYDMTLNQGPDGSFQLVELRHKCNLGNCDASAPPLKGKLVFAGSVLRWQRTDHVNLDFELFKNETPPAQK